jgi:hypothetical protein
MQVQYDRSGFVLNFLSDLNGLFYPRADPKSNNSRAVRLFVKQQSLAAVAASQNYDDLSRPALRTGRRIHVGVHCDVCNAKNIEGDRYACTICLWYNLCSKCFCAGRFSNSHLPAHPCLCVPRYIFF